MQLPWKRKPKRKVTPQTPVAQIRTLYADYQKQRMMWVYIVASSFFLIGLWIAFNLFVAIDPWTLSLPVAGVAFSMFQVYRIKKIANALRAAHAIQQEVDKAEAERKAKKEAEAAGEAAAGEGAAEDEEEPSREGEDGESPRSGNGRHQANEKNGKPESDARGGKQKAS